MTAYIIRLQCKRVDGMDTLTCELAHRRTPPIGAKITPTTKKRGSTLFGFKIGLFDGVRDSISPLGKIICLLPGLEALLSKSSVFVTRNSVSIKKQELEGVLG